jgi:hypothetical protein
MRIRAHVLKVLSLAISTILVGTTMEAQETSQWELHVAHLTLSYPGAPGGRGLVITASEEANVAMLHANFAAGNPADLEYMKTHVRHLLSALDVQVVDQGPGLGYGLKQALETSIAHMTTAVNTEGVSDVVRTHGPRFVQSAEGVLARVAQMTQTADRVLSAGRAAEAASLVEELRELALQLDTGSGSPSGIRDGMNHLEDEAYSILIGERQLRVLQ